MKKTIVLAGLLSSLLCAGARAEKLPDGLWKGYDPEFSLIAERLLALAQATPPEKFAWRPATGVRSTGEVYMHIVMANLWLTGLTGAKTPAFDEKLEKTVTQKAQVIDWLKRSLEIVKAARAHTTPADLHKKVRVYDRDSDVDAIFLRIILHDSEHMGQLVAYARSCGITPPWSKE
ncbi:MAG TPA: DinB family protein [Polyangia bacterium]|nr:DinB family protein [Polyangia bacterium]